MSITKEQVRLAAFQLNSLDRQALAEELLLSISGEESAAIDAEWLQETRRRDKDFAEGRTSAQPADAVIHRLLAKGRP
jgi:hypothetical protein